MNVERSPRNDATTILSPAGADQQRKSREPPDLVDVRDLGYRDLSCPFGGIIFPLARALVTGLQEGGQKDGRPDLGVCNSALAALRRRSS